MEWLALDLGSTFTKCARVDPQRGVLQSGQERTPPPLKAGEGRHELDAQAYYAQALSLMRRMAGPDVAGVLISTQMHGWLLADDRFCPVTPYVSWQDRASLEPGPDGVPYLERLRRRVDGASMERSGVPVKANLAMSSLYARLKTGLTPVSGQRFCTLGGYVIGRLTGEHVCHLTNAGPSGLCDVQDAAWSQERIRAAGLSALRFPRIETGFRPVGMTAFLGRPVPVFPDIGDHQVCVLGAGTEPETELNVSIGTAGLIGALTPSFEPGAYERRPWIEPGLYLRSVSGLPGGRQIAVLHGFYESVLGHVLPREEAARRAWEMMTHAQAGSGLRVRPDFFSGEGSIAGIGTAFDAGMLTGSLYEEIARAYAGAALGIGLPFEAVRFTGGCAQKNPALRRALCGALGLDARGGFAGAMEGMRRLARMAERFV